VWARNIHVSATGAHSMFALVPMGRAATVMLLTLLVSQGSHTQAPASPPPSGAKFKHKHQTTRRRHLRLLTSLCFPSGSLRVLSPETVLGQCFLITVLPDLKKGLGYTAAQDFFHSFKLLTQCDILPEFSLITSNKHYTRRPCFLYVLQVFL